MAKQSEYARAVDGHVMLSKGGWFWQTSDAGALARIQELSSPEHHQQRAEIMAAYFEAKQQRPSECEHLPAFRSDGLGTRPL